MTPSDQLPRWKAATEVLLRDLDSLYHDYFTESAKNPESLDEAAAEFIEQWPRIKASLEWALNHPLLHYVPVGGGTVDVDSTDSHD